jgi:hypothetical protein
MPNYKITYISENEVRSRSVIDTSPDYDAAVRVAANFKDAKIISIVELKISCTKYLLWLTNKNTAGMMQEIVNEMYFEDGEYLEAKDVSGGDMVELLFQVLSECNASIEDYIRESEQLDKLGINNEEASGIDSGLLEPKQP